LLIKSNIREPVFVAVFLCVLAPLRAPSLRKDISRKTQRRKGKSQRRNLDRAAH
jgi:hypothetical protein